MSAAPGPGDVVHHARYGVGTVQYLHDDLWGKQPSADGARMTVQFGQQQASLLRDDPAVTPGPAPAPLPPGVRVQDRPGGARVVRAPYATSEFVAGMQGLGADYDESVRAWQVPPLDDPEALAAVIRRAHAEHAEHARNTPAPALPAGVTITPGPGGEVLVVGPYNREFMAAAREAGGVWVKAQKAWMFGPGQAAKARELASAHYAASRPQARKAPSSAPRAGKPGKASPAQVKYAARLLARASDPEDDLTFGPVDEYATRADLENMTPAEISSLIRSLKEGLGMLPGHLARATSAPSGPIRAGRGFRVPGHASTPG